MTATDKLAKAVCDTLNNCPEVYRIIEEAGENAEQVKEAMYNMLWTAALMNDEKLRNEVADEVFAEVMTRLS